MLPSFRGAIVVALSLSLTVPFSLFPSVLAVILAPLMHTRFPSCYMHKFRDGFCKVPSICWHSWEESWSGRGRPLPFVLLPDLLDPSGPSLLPSLPNQPSLIPGLAWFGISREAEREGRGGYV